MTNTIRPIARAAAAALFLLVCSPSGIAQEPWRGHPGVSFNEHEVVFELEGQEPLRLGQLIELANELTGTVYSLVDGEAGSGLTGTLESRTISLVGGLKVARADFSAFFHQQMRDHGLAALGPVEEGAPVVRLALDNREMRGVIKQSGTFLTPEEVRAGTADPLRFVICVRRLEFAQAQSIGVNLRTAIGSGSSAQADSFMPLPHENALLIQGFAPFVVQALDLIDELDVAPPVSSGIPVDGLRAAIESGKIGVASLRGEPEAGAAAAAGDDASAAAEEEPTGLVDEKVAMWAVLAACFLLLVGNRMAIQGVRRDLRRLASRD